MGQETYYHLKKMFTDNLNSIFFRLRLNAMHISKQSVCFSTLLPEKSRQFISSHNVILRQYLCASLVLPGTTHGIWHKLCTDKIIDETEFINKKTCLNHEKPTFATKQRN